MDSSVIINSRLTVRATTMVEVVLPGTTTMVPLTSIMEEIKAMAHRSVVVEGTEEEATEAETITPREARAAAMVATNG
jgi:hypothetical protein